MLKSKISKGFTLIEVMFAIVIFSTLFLTGMSIQTNYIRLKIYNDRILSYRFYIETIRNRLLYNSTYEELNVLRNSSKMYINKIFLNSECVKTENINTVFDSCIEDERLYMKAVIEGEEVLKIILQLNIQIHDRPETISCEFYKGYY
jgi:prepilin-type N-terminal cleavage/methylation domain-containing protein